MFFNGYRKIDQREISLHSLTFKCILAIIFLNYFSFCMKNNNSSDSLKFVAIVSVAYILPKINNLSDDIVVLDISSW